MDLQWKKRNEFIDRIQRISFEEDVKEFEMFQNEIKPSILLKRETYERIVESLGGELIRGTTLVMYDKDDIPVYDPDRFVPRTNLSLDEMIELEYIGNILGYPPEAVEDFNKYFNINMKDGKLLRRTKISYEGIIFALVGRNLIIPCLEWCSSKYRDKIVKHYKREPIIKINY